MAISLTIAEKKQILSEVYSNVIACLITGEVSNYSFTVSGNSLTVTGHDFVNGCVVRVSNTGGSLPDGLERGYEPTKITRIGLYAIAKMEGWLDED